MYPLHLEKQNEELYAYLFKKGAKPVQSAVIDFIKTNYDKLVPNHIKSDSPDSIKTENQTEEAKFDTETLRDFLVRLRKEHGNLSISSETYQKQIALNFRLLDAHAKALVDSSIEKAIKKGSINTLSGLKQTIGGIDLTKNLTQDFLKRTVKENVSFIQIKHTDYVDSLEKTLLDGFIKGKSQKTIIDSIVHTTGVNESTARFWGQDQAGKFFGKVNQFRQEAAGFQGYIWRTQGDKHVRDIHRRLEGTYHRWDDPPSIPANRGGPIRQLHPGMDYRCRCWAEASISPDEAERKYEDPVVSNNTDTEKSTSNENPVDLKSALKFMEVSAIVKSTISHAADIINLVHQPPIKNLSVYECSPLNYYNGCYTIGKYRIDMNPSTGDEFTFIHEFGHFLDNRISKRQLKMATRLGKIESIKKFVEDVQKTSLYGEYLRAVKEYKFFDKDINYRDLNYIHYLMSPEELWARAYTQYIIEKCGQSDIKNLFYGRADNDIIKRQWSPDDFELIKAAVEEVLKNKI